MSQRGALLREKRQHQRADLSTSIEVVSQGASWTTVSRDISLGGMFLEGASEQPIGTEIELVFVMPGLGPIRVPGYVRWTTPTGFGVQFGLIGARLTHAIGLMIRQSSPLSVRG